MGSNTAKLTRTGDARYNGAVKVVTRLHESGFTAYFVGGCVRDLLLGQTPKDYDVATDAKPEEVQSLFPGAKGFGTRFGVSEVPTSYGIIEVAAFREDGFYYDHRRPAWVNYAGIEEDSRRRDFTINALYYNPSNDRIIDLVDGLPDLKQRILRMIGDPFERFDDDWLRMLRAVRFAARFALRFDPLTFEALYTVAPLITGVAPERRTEEIRLMLHSPNAGRALGLLQQSGLWQALWPDFPFVTRRVRKAVKLLRSEANQNLGETKKIWAAFFTDAASAIVESSCRELRLTRAEKRELRLE